MENRLSRRAFLGSDLFRLLQKFKKDPKVTIQNQIDFTIYNLKHDDNHDLSFDAKVTTGSEGKYVVKAEFIVEAMLEEAVLEAGYEVLDETFTVPSMTAGEIFVKSIISGIADQVELLEELLQV
ncbi:hypothetical protein R1sor_000283 [Riccia sorocarpa]|uniref:Uncharacterized protein n=1 Tax=Riccia sorocarpa TaxID=122646 RepID=A0ABD3GUN0_9MARC